MLIKSKNAIRYVWLVKFKVILIHQTKFLVNHLHAFLQDQTGLAHHGSFQLLDLIMMELKSHMTCYNSMPLIGWFYSIQTGGQIL